MFDTRKIKNIFISQKKLDKKELDKYEKELDMPIINYTLLSNMNSIYDCALAAKISHGTDLDPHFIKQQEFIGKLLGYGHDSISGHSNIQFAIMLRGNEISSVNDIISILPGLKYMNIASIPFSTTTTDDELDSDTISTCLVFGASIRALRYFLFSVNNIQVHNYIPDTSNWFKVINELTEIITELIYTTTDFSFYPDLISLGILKKENFVYYPDFTNDISPTESDDESSIDASELITKYKTPIKSNNNVTIVDYSNNLEQSVSILKEALPTANIEDIYNAIIKTSAIMIKIEDYSRAISTQINRHESAITQESQRYVDYSKAKFIDPLIFNKDKYPDLNKKYHVAIGDTSYDVTSAELGNMLIQIYPQLIEQGMLKQDARSFLPMNVETKAYHTFSLQNYIHFLEVRLDKASQPEVRSIAEFMLIALDNMLNNEVSDEFKTYILHSIYKNILNSEK